MPRSSGISRCTFFAAGSTAGTTDHAFAYLDTKLLTASNSAGTYTFGYDAQGRINRVDEPFGVWLAFEYDTNGNRKTVTDSFGGSATSRYNDQKQLVNLTFSQGNQPVLSVGETYDPQTSKLKTQTYFGTGSPAQPVASSDFTYDASGRLTDLKETGQTGTTIADYLQAYNSGGQLPSQTSDRRQLTLPLSDN